MKATLFFLMTVLLLAGTCRGVIAQSDTGYTGEGYAPCAYPVETNELEELKAQIKELSSKMDKELKKKEDKVDTKKKFSAKLSGRVFIDDVNFSGPYEKWAVAPNVPKDQSNILGLRDARIAVSGEGFNIYDYKVELSYEYGPDGNTSARLKDAYMGAKNIPGLDYVRVGHYKVESGMSYTMSARNTTAMERTTDVQLFSPGRRFGGGQTYYFANEHVRWFNGVFAAKKMDDIKYNVDDNQGIIYNTRLTFLPYYCNDGEDYLHFGGHYLYYQNPAGKNLNFTAPGSARIGGFGRAGNWYDVTAVEASQYNQGGLETAWGCGPLGISSELFGGTFGNERNMYGGYVEVRWFLTGDSRLYDKKLGVPGNVKTKKNFDCVKECVRTPHGNREGFSAKSLGAWELYTQWGFTDADRVYFVDELTGGAGGRTTDLTVGLNWYWNPNTRMMFEYIHSDGTSQGKYRASDDIYAASFRFYF